MTVIEFYLVLLLFILAFRGLIAMMKDAVERNMYHGRVYPKPTSKVRPKGTTKPEIVLKSNIDDFKYEPRPELDDLIKIHTEMKKYGLTLEEACEAMKKMASHIDEYYTIPSETIGLNMTVHKPSLGNPEVKLNIEGDEE